MKKNYPQNQPNVYGENRMPELLSPGKPVVDKILAFSAAYWTVPVVNTVAVELIMN